MSVLNECSCRQKRGRVVQQFVRTIRLLFEIKRKLEKVQGCTKRVQSCTIGCIEEPRSMRSSGARKNPRGMRALSRFTKCKFFYP